jgi:hypothetical protein
MEFSQFGNELTGDLEIMALVGNIIAQNDKVYLRLHAGDLAKRLA